MCCAVLDMAHANLLPPCFPFRRNHLGNVFLQHAAGSVDTAAVLAAVHPMLERLDPLKTDCVSFGWAAAAVSDVGWG